MKSDIGDIGVCVECGNSTKSKKLFRRFQGGAIRLLFCESCSQVLDKYLEYDTVLIFLDILLHKPQAYRHVLINRQPQIHWHLCALYLLSDAYTKWSNVNLFGSSSKASPSTRDHSVLELEFYYMLSLSCIELVAFFIGVFIGIKLLLFSTTSDQASYRDVARAVLLSSFGKLLVIPVVVWTQPSSRVCLWLTSLLVFTSNAEAIKVILKMSFLRSSMIVTLGSVAGFACNRGWSYFMGAMSHIT